MKNYLFKFDRKLFQVSKLYRFFRRLFFAVVINFYLKNSDKIEVKRNNFIFKNKKILFASFIGGNSTIMGFESFLANEFSKRGATTKIILCNKSLPACLECTYINKPIKMQFISNYDDSFCSGCFQAGKINVKNDQLFNLNDFKNDYLEDELYTKFSKLSYLELKNYSIEGVNIGEHAYAGALRYMSKSQLKDSLNDKSTLLNYLISSEITRITFEAILKIYNPDLVFTIHGLYSPHGIVSELCRSMNYKHINWNVSYRKNTFIFSPDETYHKSLISENELLWKNITLDFQKENSITDYLKSRENGEKDWISFSHKNINYLHKNDIEQRIYSMKKYSKITTLLTNVSWDAQIHYKQNIFESMIDWIFFTIEWFISNNKTLIIRIHPGEVKNKYPSQEKLFTLINQKFRHLPSNIIIIDSSIQINTYSICDLSDAIIIYGTKMGVELAPKEIPIIVAGEAWIKNKGLTHDPKNKTEYIKLLKSLDSLKPPSSFTKENALKYAYHFFFEKMVSIKGVKQFIDPGCIIFDKTNYSEKDIDDLLINLFQ